MQLLKTKDDKVSISKLKRDELQQLWLVWKGRRDKSDLEAILNHQSASEESQHAGITTNISDTDMAVVTCDHKPVNDNCNEGRHMSCGDKIMNDDNFLIISSRKKMKNNFLLKRLISDPRRL